MSRGRPPRPIGVPGKVDLTEIQTGVWQALVRVRNATGKRRKVKHVSPAKRDSRGRLIPDKEGMRARDAVLAAASALTTSPLNANLNPNTTIQALYYDHYRTYLIAQDKAPQPSTATTLKPKLSQPLSETGDSTRRRHKCLRHT